MNAAKVGTAGKIIVLPTCEPNKTEILTKKVLEDMREIVTICNAYGNGLKLWKLLADLMMLAGEINDEMDSSRKTAATGRHSQR